MPRSLRISACRLSDQCHELSKLMLLPNALNADQKKDPPVSAHCGFACTAAALFRLCVPTTVPRSKKRKYS
eukprot:5052290-Amphidinium_carterae.1